MPERIAELIGSPVPPDVWYASHDHGAGGHQHHPACRTPGHDHTGVPLVPHHVPGLGPTQSPLRQLLEQPCPTCSVIVESAMVGEDPGNLTYTLQPCGHEYGPVVVLAEETPEQRAAKREVERVTREAVAEVERAAYERGGLAERVAIVGQIREYADKVRRESFTTATGVALGAVVDSVADLVNVVPEAGTRVPIEPDPMPVFTILAKDALAVDAVKAYWDLCKARGLDWQAGQVEQALGEIIEWRRRNPQRIKLPDHKHVPVAGTDQEVTPQ